MHLYVNPSLTLRRLYQLVAEILEPYGVRHYFLYEGHQEDLPAGELETLFQDKKFQTYDSGDFCIEMLLLRLVVRHAFNGEVALSDDDLQRLVATRAEWVIKRLEGNRYAKSPLHAEVLDSLGITTDLKQPDHYGVTTEQEIRGLEHLAEMVLEVSDRALAVAVEEEEAINVLAGLHEILAYLVHLETPQDLTSNDTGPVSMTDANPHMFLRDHVRLVPVSELRMPLAIARWHLESYEGYRFDAEHRIPDVVWWALLLSLPEKVRRHFRREQLKDDEEIRVPVRGAGPALGLYRKMSHLPWDAAMRWHPADE